MKSVNSSPIQAYTTVQAMRQKTQLGTDRWLTQVQAEGRFRHVLLRQQRLRCELQIEVETLAIHEMDGSQKFLRFQMKLRAAET